MSSTTNISDIISDSADYYGLSEKEKLYATTIVIDLLSAIFEKNGVSADTSLQHYLSESSILKNNSIFTGVNSPSKINSYFDDRFDELWKRVSHPGCIHLELGTFTAWPPDKVKSYILSAGIGDFIRLDFDSKHNPDVAASATALPFKDNSIDRISSNSLFEHVANPHEILYEAHRVLRPGGVLYTAVPFHFVQHDCPSDYLRFTGAFFDTVCSEIGFAETFSDNQSTSGAYYTTHQLIKGALVDREYHDTDIVNIAVCVHIVTLVLLALAQSLDKYMVCGGASHFHSTRSVAVKAGDYIPKTIQFDHTATFLERHIDLLVCPLSGTALKQSNEDLITPDGLTRYPIIDGVPELVVKHGMHSVQNLIDKNTRLQQELNQLLNKKSSVRLRRGPHA